MSTASLEITAARSASRSWATLLRWLVALPAGVAGLAVALMVVVTCVDVVGRRFGHPLTGAYDLVEILGAITIAGALPYTTACKGHVAIELFLQKLPQRGRIVLDAFVRVVSILMFAFLTWRFIQYGAELKASGQVTLTPPVGVCVYVVSGMERDVPLETVFRGSMPFLLAMIVAAVLLIIFPDIALILPRWIHP